MRVLVVTAVAAEAEAVAAGLTGLVGDTRPLPGGYTLARHARPIPPPGATPRPPSAHTPVVDVLAAGVGPAAAAAGTATALALDTYDLVVSAGIGGGFRPHAPIGSVVVADAIVAADLGAETPDGYLPVDELGFGRSTHRPPGELAARIAKTLNSLYAPVLTVSTVTGTAARAAELSARHPRAAAEAMEGFGVAEAAAAHALPVLEIRAISNAVGPRDRAAWRIGQALDALRYAFQLLTPVLEESP
ncbi:futalosine hydrolase [Streptomyces lunaelactis]|uniref:futalosine hydrolase n=4 Tax=Streptomyces lunaelactis TaxID=1535768 RepID=UPI001585624F|nr:futalosine hydrolase [Streptomyces lunaelactis]NUL11598.1 futalosine hydrolase [Streptomyces lunaelactis]